MNALYKCESLNDIKSWLKDQPASELPEKLLTEFDRLIQYKNAVEWNQLVLVCEALAITGWSGAEPLEAYCGKGLSGSWETRLVNSEWVTRQGSWRDWSKCADSFVIYGGTDTHNYHVEKLNSQRNRLDTNPFKVSQYVANCQTSVIPFLNTMNNLRLTLERSMRPEKYGEAFYVTNIYCHFSAHDYPDGWQWQYYHDAKDVPDGEDVYLKPHIDFGKLRTKRGRLCWEANLYFTKAWGEMPLVQQKESFRTDFETILTEFGSRIKKKKLDYNYALAIEDAMKIVKEWVTV